MGLWNYKNYALRIQIRDNLTDPRYVDFVTRWDYSIDDVTPFQESIEPLDNLVARKLLNFIISYSKIDLLPDYHNYFEPIKVPFDKDDIMSSVHSLAFPSGTLFLKKKRRFVIMIENLWYSMFFDPKQNYKVIKPKRIIHDNDYLGNIQMCISKNSKFYSMDMLQQLLDDFCTYLQTDYGVIIDQETNEVLYQYKPAQ